MKDDNNIKSFSAGDIERYHKGLMSAKEMNALEKAAMDDPFLADALEGYAVAGVKADDDIKDLQNRLVKRTDSGKVVGITPPRRYYGLRVAAMIILVAGAGILAYTLLSKKNNENSIAQTKKEESTSTTPSLPDSGNKNQNGFLQPDTIKNSIAIENKNSLSTNKDRTIKEEKTDSSINFKADSFNYSTANTTRNLAAEKVASAPVANNDLLLKSLDEQKEKSKADSLEMSARSRKADNKEAEVFPLNEVVVSSRPDATFNKSKKLSKAAEARTANTQGVTNNALKQSADSTNYSKLNIFRGRVTDASNNGISFANVTVNDVNVGTYADAKGYFSLVAPDSVLNVSLKAVGFNNSQVQLRTILPSNQVILQEDKSMDAIVMSNKKPNTNRSRSAEMVLTEPEPDDGWEKYDSYLANNMKVPEAKEEIQKKGGQVELSFEVNNIGEPVNITVTKSLCKECDEEAIRLLKEGPKWKKKKKKERGKVTIAF